MEFNNCILCSSSNLKVMPRYQASHLVKCENCNFIFSKLNPSASELHELYSHYNRFTEISPITIKRYNELLDQFEKYRSTNNLLDMGCSNGLFLDCAKKRGWNVYGTEFAQESIDFCAQKNITVFKSDNLTETFYSIRFDVITSFEVIEHINTPIDEITIIKKVLRKNGLFYFTTPNFNSLSRLLLKEKWNVIGYPEHLSFYTPRTMTRFLSQHGFKKIRVLTSGISFSRFNQSIKQMPETPINDEKLRSQIEANPLLLFAKSVLNRILNAFNAGDSLKGYFLNA